MMLQHADQCQCFDARQPINTSLIALPPGLSYVVSTVSGQPVIYANALDSPDTQLAAVAAALDELTRDPD